MGVCCSKCKGKEQNGSPQEEYTNIMSSNTSLKKSVIEQKGKACVDEEIEIVIPKSESVDISQEKEQTESLDQYVNAAEEIDVNSAEEVELETETNNGSINDENSPPLVENIQNSRCIQEDQPIQSSYIKLLQQKENGFKTTDSLMCGITPETTSSPRRCQSFQVTSSSYDDRPIESKYAKRQTRQSLQDQLLAKEYEKEQQLLREKWAKELEDHKNFLKEEQNA